MSSEKTAAERIEEIEARRRDRRESLEAQHEAQQIEDAKAIAQIKARVGGDEKTVPITWRAWTPGTTTCMLFRVPRKGENPYQPFVRQMMKSPPDASALESEVRRCCLYPAPDSDLFAVSWESAPPGVLYEAVRCILEEIARAMTPTDLANAVTPMLNRRARRATKERRER